MSDKAKRTIAFADWLAAGAAKRATLKACDELKRYCNLLLRGIEDVKAGRLHEHEDVKREILGP